MATKVRTTSVLTPWRLRTNGSVRTDLLRILCVQPSVITPYELFPPKQKKNPTSQCAPLDQFLVQWSTLAGRICVSGTMAQQNLKPEEKVGGHHASFWAAEARTCKTVENGFFWPHPPLFIWKCMNPTLLPCILSGGTYSSTLWAVHPCTQGFELILGRHYLPQTQKTSFFPLFLVSWGRNNNFTTTQSSILWRWDHGTSKPEEKVGGHHASFWAAEARTCKTVENGFFWPHPPLFIWKCMNPTLLPCILSGGTYSSTLWAVHPCTQGFELILGRHYLPQTQKTSFFPLFLVSWGMNNNFTTTQSSILWRWDHGTSKPEEKVGGHHASFWAAEARTCKTVENGFFWPHPPLFIWKCMNPTLLPCILSGGTYSSTLWAVHPCTQGFELILGRHYLPQTQKTSFFPLFLVSWGRNNNFTTTQSSILWRWDHGTSKPEEKVGGHHASFWAAEARTCKTVENGFFWPHPPLFIWKCMNPTLLPCILSGGTYSSTLWAVHPCTQGFELILGRHYLPQTQKTSFFPLFLVSWGMNNNFTTTQSSILWRWDHGTSKPEEKVGGHHASFSAAEARTCKTGWKWDFSTHPPPVHVMCFSIIFHPL